MSERIFYLDDYTDEVIPCAPTLEAWAKWLSEGDPDCPHEIPADGSTFKATTIDVLAEVEVCREGGKWSIVGDVPPEATGFVLRGGRSGWDGETWSDTPLGYFEVNDDGSWYSDGDTDDLVCTRDGPNLIVRYEAAGPRLVIVEGRA